MIVLSEVAVPTEGVRISQPQVRAYFEENCAGDGTLTVSESSVTWVSTTGRGISLTYQSIVLHAVSTDLSSFPFECVYVLVDASKSDLNLHQESGANGDGEDAEDSDSEAGSNVVIRFVPTDTSVIQTIYAEMCKCQELNPDENDDFSDDGEDEMTAALEGDFPEGNWYTAATHEDEIELNEEGRANLERILGEHNGGGDGHEEEDDERMEE